MDKKLKNRDEIENQFKWDIESMFSSNTAWEADYEKAINLSDDYKKYQGSLTKDAKTLLSALQEKDKIWQIAEKVYVFARMKRDEDNTVDTYQAMADKCHSLLAKISANLSFFTPELLSASYENIEIFLAEEPDLRIYEHLLKSIFAEKAHVLSEAEENLLANMSEITSSTNDIFTMLNNADLSFGEIKDSNDILHPLSHGNFINYMESDDRMLRKNAYEAMYTAYKNHINTIATTYNYNTKTDAVSAKIRKYESSLIASLCGDNIPVSVYTNLIKIVNETLPTMYKYMDLRKKNLGVDALHMYDVYAPLVKLPNVNYTYEDAVKLMKEALAPLGNDYIEKLTCGVNSGWIDVYENTGKTSGAYSFGSYDSKPFILLNFSNMLKDVFTLVHEMGHSMHSLYTRAAQPFVYGGHSIFTAEVASTVNESLLINHLLKNTVDPDFKKYLIALHIEEFRTTLFRQTMFAEFELLTHEAVERGESLTAQFLCDEYEKLNKKYFGNGVVYDDFIRYEWSRIPHFYNAFYVYQYATGYSAATAISQKILTEGAHARDNYLKFLTTGESDYPVELLKIAGVDMGSTEPIKLAMDKFTELVNELEALS